jgi:hypothetical protein
MRTYRVLFAPRSPRIAFPARLRIARNSLRTLNLLFWYGSHFPFQASIALKTPRPRRHMPQFPRRCGFEVRPVEELAVDHSEYIGCIAWACSSTGSAPALRESRRNHTSAASGVAYAETRGATTLPNRTEVGLKPFRSCGSAVVRSAMRLLIVPSLG